MKMKKGKNMEVKKDKKSLLEKWTRFPLFWIVVLIVSLIIIYFTSEYFKGFYALSSVKELINIYYFLSFWTLSLLIIWEIVLGIEKLVKREERINGLVHTLTGLALVYGLLRLIKWILNNSLAY